MNNDEILKMSKFLYKNFQKYFCYKNVQNIIFLAKKYAKSMKNYEILKMSELLQEICLGS